MWSYCKLLGIFAVPLGFIQEILVCNWIWASFLYFSSSTLNVWSFKVFHLLWTEFYIAWDSYMEFHSSADEYPDLLIPFIEWDVIFPVCFSLSLSSVRCPQMCWFISGPFILFCWSSCLFLCRCSFVLVSIDV